MIIYSHTDFLPILRETCRILDSTEIAEFIFLLDTLQANLALVRESMHPYIPMLRAVVDAESRRRQNHD